MAHVTALQTGNRTPGRGETEAALSLAARLPRIMLESRRVAAAAHGVHGRRRAGQGESFWQFRPFSPGEAAARIDWRRSARDQRLYVRQREWEAAQSVWLWIDRSASMAFASSLAQTSKVERAIVVGFALADALVEAGERVGLLGLLPPRASRRIVEDLAEAMVLDKAGEERDLPPRESLPPLNEAVLVSDFLVPPAALAASVEGLASRGARGHLILVADPVEETFPFTGQAELADPEAGLRLRVGDAASWGEDYRARLAQHRAAITAITAGRGWTMSIHRTDRPASEGLLRALTLIAASRGAAAGPSVGAWAP
ncbi:DUF58 domain-containing protein [Chelatococcus reniformis]|uniref:DUF58 domain-containing protein n=1 Tax=Chelatococcus reniformis TaxID=1494448 RepID=A0A916UNT6_9HYPH|nr:DUF58 domain-containing protein [Chelatococcus reniformis]GGC80619.1 hypothetical protein GCM10010994_43250 [Chelatococcus reniformis]